MKRPLFFNRVNRAIPRDECHRARELEKCSFLLSARAIRKPTRCGASLISIPASINAESRIPIPSATIDFAAPLTNVAFVGSGRQQRHLQHRIAQIDSTYLCQPRPDLAALGTQTHRLPSHRAARVPGHE